MLQGTLPSAIALFILAAIGAYIALVHNGIRAKPGELRHVAGLTCVVLLLQAGHFTEELTTGFHHRFPGLFGLPPMLLATFVGMNVFCLVLWAVSAMALTRGMRVALFPIWFLTVGCIANAVVHPALSLFVGGYFPGLVTSPLLGIAGYVLGGRLIAITQPDA